MYTIWRVGPGGVEFQLTTTGSSSVKETALSKARSYNERLLAGDPGSQDRFIVRDSRGREMKTPAVRIPA